MNYFIGIDGGGTNCRARLEDANGELLSTAQSGAANIMRDLPAAISSILDACEKAIANADKPIALNQVHVSAGLAGANIPSAREALQRWKHPFAELNVISDLHAACIGAHGGNDGAVIVCGTGSSGTSYSKGQFADIGGHGFMVGDMASGAWLGLHAVQHTLVCLDGLKPVDALALAVCEKLGVDDAVSIVTEVADYQSKHYASIAPAMVELLQINEPVTTALFEKGAAYLNSIAGRLLTNNSGGLVLIGGLSAVYQPMLERPIQNRIVQAQLRPEQGAIAHIKHQLVKEVS